MSMVIESSRATSIPRPLDEQHGDDYQKPPVNHVMTLGTIRHRHEETNEIILVPTPSNDRKYLDQKLLAILWLIFL